MATAVIALLDDAAARSAMAGRARDAVQSGFTIEHMVQRVYELYLAIGIAHDSGSAQLAAVARDDDQPATTRS
jgi:hypothetical protein